MTVYPVHFQPSEDGGEWIVAVFSTREAAVHAAASLNRREGRPEGYREDGVYYVKSHAPPLPFDPQLP